MRVRKTRLMAEISHYHEWTFVEITPRDANKSRVNVLAKVVLLPEVSWNTSTVPAHMLISPLFHQSQSLRIRHS